jgi:hypothetical protein
MLTTDPQFDPAELETLAAEFARANDEMERWKLYKASIVQRFHDLHGRGLIPSKFAAAGRLFARMPGKTSATADAIAKGQLQALTTRLKELGHITESVGDPFWTSKPIKDPAAPSPAP